MEPVQAKRCESENERTSPNRIVFAILVPSTGWRLTRLVARRAFLGSLPSTSESLYMNGNDGVVEVLRTLSATLCQPATGSLDYP